MIVDKEKRKDNFPSGTNTEKRGFADGVWPVLFGWKWEEKDKSVCKLPCVRFITASEEKNKQSLEKMKAKALEKEKKYIAPDESSRSRSATNTNDISTDDAVNKLKANAKVRRDLLKV